MISAPQPLGGYWSEVVRQRSEGGNRRSIAGKRKPTRFIDAP